MKLFIDDTLCTIKGSDVGTILHRVTDYTSTVNVENKTSQSTPCISPYKTRTIPDNNVQTTFNSTTNLYSNLGKIVQKHNGLCIAHINVRSIAASSKLQEVNLLLCNGCIDILGITETWLTESHSNAHIQIEGYNLERCDRKNRTGGGVLFYIKDNIKYKLRQDLVIGDSSEMVCIEVQSDTKQPNSIISCIYRPPNADPVYFENIVNSIEKISNESGDCITLGDLNYNYILDENLHKNPINQLENMFLLTQLIKSPTRITPTSSSLIDVILTSVPDKHVHSGVFQTCFSDHFLTFTIVNMKKKQNSHKLVKYRDYKSFVPELFLNDVTKCFSNIDEFNEDTNACWLKWKSNFLTICDKHAPFKTRRLKQRSNPWMTKDILNMMYKRNHIHKKALNSHDPNERKTLWNQYKHMRNKVTALIKQARKDYYNNITENAPSSKQMWRKIREVIPKPGSDTITHNISADEFNDFFTNIGSTVVNDHYTTSSKYQWTLPSSIYTFNFTELKSFKIEKYLQNLPSESKNDILNFDTKLLKLSAALISPSLTHIFNLSMKEGVVPDDWKIAKLTPAYKNKGDKFARDNYRPLSVVGHIAKNIETSAKIQLVDYLLLHHFISSDQSAYLRNHSTTTSLHRLLDDILGNVNNKEMTAICFLDIKKCFDTIDHSILLTKLYHYGIRDNELKWFKSYLSNRRQCVSLNGDLSKEMEVSIGVPQGTVLGPVLFLLYINDLSNAVSDGEINIFADDVAIYSSSKCLSSLTTAMSSIMNNVSNWYKLNRLVLSTDKCSSMLISGDKCNTRKLDIDMNGTVLNQVESTKYLGVVIDDQLSWRKQTSEVCRKLAYNVSNLNKARNVLPPKVLRNVYLSTFIPVVDYACTVWSNSSIFNMKRIHRMEKMAARAISGNYDYIHVRGDSLLEELALNTFEDRKKYHLSLLIYKSIHGIAPHYLVNQVLFSYEVNQRNLRSLDNMILYLPKVNKNIFKNSLFYVGAQCWNTLPLYIKESTSVPCFKKHLKKHLLPF